MSCLLLAVPYECHHSTDGKEYPKANCSQTRCATFSHWPPPRNEENFYQDLYHTNKKQSSDCFLFMDFRICISIFVLRISIFVIRHPTFVFQLPTPHFTSHLFDYISCSFLSAKSERESDTEGKCNDKSCEECLEKWCCDSKL